MWTIVLTTLPGKGAATAAYLFGMAVTTPVVARVMLWSSSPAVSHISLACMAQVGGTVMVSPCMVGVSEVFPTSPSPFPPAQEASRAMPRSR